MQEPNSKFNTQSPLLTTSLGIPQLNEGLINRPDLMEKMDQVLYFPLTLISAPTGFGKTTLISQWASGNENTHVQDLVTWVSVEKESDLRQFWTYIVAAVQEIESEIGISALTLLDSPQPPIHAILKTLINEISEVEQDLVLILDDYHHIDDPTIHATLTFFIDHLPSNLHMVIASRSQPPLPLARWRASNQLYELREENLRFTDEEVVIFINELKGLKLSPHEILALETRTEGWIAGLQLVALSIQGLDDQSKRRFVSTFTGSQRYVLDYLIEEVLHQQPDPIKTFLLRTSVLDRLNASLCDSVTGQNDAQAIIDYLERGHLFVIPLDHKQCWYRYHHLFKDVLYHQLKQTEPDSVLELHRRAAGWFIEADRTEDAIRHACAAHDWELAIKLIEGIVRDTWNRGEIRKIINWLGPLPQAYLDAYPDLYWYYLRALFHGGEMESAKGLLGKAEAALKSHLGTKLSTDGQVQLGAIYAFRTLAMAVSGMPEHAVQVGNDALSLLPPEKLDVRAYASNALGVAYYYLGNTAWAVQKLAEGCLLAHKAGNLFPMVAAALYQAESLKCQAQLRQAAQVLQQALDQAQIPNQATISWMPAASYVCASFGHLLYEWNRLDESERYLQEAIELGEELVFGSAPWSAYQTLARIRCVQGDFQSAREMIMLAQQYGRIHSLPIPKRLIECIQAQTWLALRQLDQPERWARSYALDHSPSPPLIQEFESITLARLYLLQGKPDKALTLLNQTRTTAVLEGHKGCLIEVLVLVAMAQQALDESRSAADALKDALEIAKPENYIRMFVDEGPPMAALLYQVLAQEVMTDYVSKLLAAFPTNDMVPSSSSHSYEPLQASSMPERLVEPLSAREIEVLQWMASGASNQDIADTLIIAFTTVKKHVSNIIRKLVVDNRMQAVAKGRNLGLCK